MRLYNIIRILSGNASGNVDNTEYTAGMKKSSQPDQISAQKKTIGQVLNELQPGSFFTIDKVKPVGALQARRQGDGAVMLYWRYTVGTRESNKSERIKIGIYDSTAPVKSHTPGKKGYSVQAATKAAEAMAIEHAEHREEGGRPALKLAEIAAAAAEVAKAESEAKHTLINLLYAYCDLLKARGQVSHKDARGIFRMHVAEAFPELAKTQANTITDTEQITTVLNKLMEDGKRRTANKLRSYARAAYQIALTAKADHTVPLLFKDFNVKINPVAGTVQDKLGNKADKNPLTPDEMIQYWGIIKTVEGVRGAMLRFHMLTGGQRIEQLSKLLCQDVNKSEKIIKIYDSKGKNHVIREHFIQLLPEAFEELQSIRSTGKYAMTTDFGKTHVNALTLTRWAQRAVGTQIDNFELKRIRSGVETLLANQKVDKETRGHLQSHGISGVQQIHYNGYEYAIEKYEALQLLLDTLNQKISVRKFANDRNKVISQTQV